MAEFIILVTILIDLLLGLFLWADIKYQQNGRPLDNKPCPECGEYCGIRVYINSVGSMQVVNPSAYFTSCSGKRTLEHLKEIRLNQSQKEA